MADDVVRAADPLKPMAAPSTGEEEHYEVVSEYRIGEGPPPLFLVIFFVLVVGWALFSWIPFFGY